MQPTPVYLVGAGHRCAQGSSSHPGTGFRPPALRRATALEPAQALPYFAAFDDELLTLPALCRLLEAEVLAAAAAAGWTPESLAHVPLFIGSTSYVMSDREARQTRHHSRTRYTLNEIAGYLKQRFGHPNVFSFATSCTASAQALLAATHTLANGFSPRALVLGFESFNHLTFEHFHAMHLLAEEADGLPFLDAGGMILGEAAACVALASQPTATVCRIRGAIGQTDFDSLTASSSDALHQLIAACLQQAGLSPADIGAIKTHASGGGSDTMETEVLHRLLPHAPAILFKPHTGHTLGASAALETALLWQAMHAPALPELPHPTVRLPLPHLHGQPLPAGCCLNYFLGFGGSHSAWILDWQPALT